MAYALEAVGVCPIKEYIQIHQATIMGKVDFRTIYELCTGAEWMPGSIWMMMLWDQDVGREAE